MCWHFWLAANRRRPSTGFCRPLTRVTRLAELVTIFCTSSTEYGEKSTKKVTLPSTMSVRRSRNRSEDGNFGRTIRRLGETARLTYKATRFCSNSTSSRDLIDFRACRISTKTCHFADLPPRARWNNPCWVGYWRSPILLGPYIGSSTKVGPRRRTTDHRHYFSHDSSASVFVWKIDSNS